MTEFIQLTLITAGVFISCLYALSLLDSKPQEEAQDDSCSDLGGVASSLAGRNEVMSDD